MPSFNGLMLRISISLAPPSRNIPLTQPSHCRFTPTLLSRPQNGQMKNTILSIALLLVSSLCVVAQKGTISGKIVDSKTGEELIGVAAMIENSNPPMGAVTDLDGNFVIPNVPEGMHNVVLKYMGYTQKVYKNLKVTSGQVATLNTSMQEESTDLNEVVIVAEARRETQSAIFIMQKNSTVIQSGISSEDIKRSPDRSSSDALKRVSGATIQDGKFAVIRGLADRYNMAMLNSVILPSTEPDRKSFAFDIFPSNVLDNILIMKTGQPDLPSEWAGGLIQLNTRDIPEKSFFNINYGISFTEQTTFRKFNNYEGSKTDWLGFDNGARTLPNNFPSILDFQYQTKDSARNAYGKQFAKNSWQPRKNMIAYPGQSIQLSGGYALRKKDFQFGGIVALTYSNTLRFTEGTRDRQDADGSPYLSFNDETYNNSVNAALLANLSVVIKNRHRISWKNVYTINSDDNTIVRDGTSYFSDVNIIRTNLEFTSSRVYSSNLIGDHSFGKNDIKIRWNAGITLLNRDQPATKRYSYDQRLGDTSGYLLNLPPLNGGSDPKYGAMFHSYMNERVYNAGTELTVPFRVYGAKQNVRVGGFYQNRSRDFEARNFFVRRRFGQSSPLRALPIDSIINQQNFENGLLAFEQVAFPQDQYRAQSSTYAAYAMMENNIAKWLKAVWGFRFEYFTQQLTSANKIEVDLVRDENGNIILDENFQPQFIGKYVDTTYTKNYFSGAYASDSLGNVKTRFPLLPSLNLIFKLNESMNMRASYSQSMSRPEFRECAPFRYYDFLTENELVGNPGLLQTFIHNADLRFEYFLGRGQAVNASVFYKRFQNTIELAALSGGGVDIFAYSNAAAANLIGVELEIRKNLDFITKKLEDLTFTANVAYIYSRVDLRNVQNLAADEIRRPMMGQSPYIINLGLSYQHPRIGTGVSLLYNQAGERLSVTGILGNPAWYEHFRPLLDLQISQKFWKDRGIIRLTFSDLIAKPTIFYQNLLTQKDAETVNNSADPTKKLEQLNDRNRHYQKGQDYVVRSFQNYRTYSLQIGFTF